MSGFSPDFDVLKKTSSSRPNKVWKSLISALQKKVTSTKNLKSFNGTTTMYTSLSPYHRHFHYQINPRSLSITRGGFRDEASAVWQGKNGGRDASEDDEDDNDDVTVLYERLRLHGDVDACAEVFIKKTNERWKLERQKSAGNYMEIMPGFYKH